MTPKYRTAFYINRLRAAMQESGLTADTINELHAESLQATRNGHDLGIVTDLAVLRAIHTLLTDEYDPNEAA